MTCDLLIRGATIIDGSGSRSFIGDVAIRDGKIARIGTKLEVEAREVRDAAGLWLTPGFIDIHTHYDLEVEIAPGLSESVRHGVTTVVMGHCSLSLTMGEPDDLADIFLRVENFPEELIRHWLQSAVRWRSPHDYLEHLASLKLGPNVAPMLGHSALRASVMGLARSVSEHASDAELEGMRRLAHDALDAGCIGISVDMVPWHMMSGRFKGRTIPSQHAAFREYRMLADVCREHDAVFQVTPNPQKPVSFAGILRMSVSATKLPLRITILSALDSVVARSLWRLFPATLFAFNRLLGCNIRFQTLTEAFTVYSDGPITPLFEEFRAGVELNDCVDRDARLALWRDRDFRARFAREWKHAHRTFHRDLAGMMVTACPDTSLQGKSFEEIAAGRDAVESFMELLERYDTDLRWVSTGANDRRPVRERLMRHPHILPGSSNAPHRV